MKVLQLHKNNKQDNKQVLKLVYEHMVVNFYFFYCDNFVCDIFKHMGMEKRMGREKRVGTDDEYI
jgi:hypothetical protein